MSDRRLAPAEDLNLVPIMNLVTILIPFLLMAAQFVSLAAIDSSVPAIAPEETVHQPDPDTKLRLSVFITDHGFSVLGAGLPLGVDTDEDGRVTLPCPAGCDEASSYDHAGLSDVLADIKDQHPDHEEVVLVPEGEVDYATLITTMDTTRQKGDTLLFPAAVIAGAQ